MYGIYYGFIAHSLKCTQLTKYETITLPMQYNPVNIIELKTQEIAF